MENTMRSTSKRVISEMRRLRDELALRVTALSTEDLGRQSACREWDVSQVLSHMGSAAELGMQLLEASLRGEEPPGREAYQPVWDRWNAMPPRDRATGWLEWTEKYQSALEAIGDATLETLEVRLSFFPQPLDAAAFMGMRLNEQALHTWDIDVAFDDAAVIAGSSAELLVDRIPQTMRWAGKADRWRGTEPQIDVTITAPARTWRLTIGDAVMLDDRGEASAPVRISMPSETFIRLVSGRLRGADTPRVVTSGPLRIEDLQAVFPGF